MQENIVNNLGTRPILANGNEAVAWAALVSKIDYFSHYPGSPVNLIEPALQRLTKKYKNNIYINDALNEHIATLAAAGASYCGARSMVVMKHVGMNIASDPLNYIGYTGVRGGMVFVIGTDPGANCSTGEEDVHWYAPQINFPLIEPSSVQEIYRYVREAFVISEKYQIPVLIFVPTRLCYNYDLIEVPDTILPHEERDDFYFEKDDKTYVNVGFRAIRNHRLLLEKIKNIAEAENHSKTFFNLDAEIGLVTRGIAFGHTFEIAKRLDISNKVHLLHINMVFPLHYQSIRNFFKNKKEVIFIEDQDGFLESQVKMQFFNDLDCKIYGKNYFPKYGEIQLEQVNDFLSNKFEIEMENEPLKLAEGDIPERLGTFCEGCPHRASYFAIDKALKGTDGLIGGDIGCSSLPPFRADWLLCMNAGIGISQGMAHVLKKQTVISTGGDGSFFHAGLISLRSAIENKINLLHIVFDNRNMAMTGHQPSSTTHSNLNYQKLLKSIGVDRVIEVSANHPRKFKELLVHEIKEQGVRVIWVKGDCVQIPTEFRQLIRKTRVLEINHEKCGSCTECYDNLGCPAIDYVKTGLKRLAIDENRCMRCGACREVCEKGAIHSSFSCSISTALNHAFEFFKPKMSE